MTDDEFFRLGEALTTHDYRYAKTMPKHPHWYTVRYDWDSDEQFVDAVKLIRKYGYDRRFFSKTYRSFNLNEHYYWTMGEPIDIDGKPWTYILNRALRANRSPYDLIGASYDSMFRDEYSMEENAYVMNAIGWKEGESVLDIGCGTGLFLEYNECKDYLGVDPSKTMLYFLERKFPDANTVYTDFEHFYTGRKFDKVVSTFGSCSYIDPRSMGRLRHFKAAGGKLFLMFYKDGYRPVTYDKAGVEVSHHSVDEYLREFGDVSVEEWHQFVIVTD